MYCNICGKKLDEERTICKECEEKRAKYNKQNIDTVNIVSTEKNRNIKILK